MPPRCSTESAIQPPPPPPPPSPPETTHFVENSISPKVEVIDKSIYSHGEPMEMSSDSVAAKDMEIIDEPMEVCKNGYASDEAGEIVKQTNGLDCPAVSSSDEMTPEESSRMEKAYKTRRRRKEIANSYL